MGRPRTPLDATADAKAVRALRSDKDLEGWQRQRLQAALLGSAGVLSLPQIAEDVGDGARIAGSWFRQPVNASPPAKSPQFTESLPWPARISAMKAVKSERIGSSRFLARTGLRSTARAGF